MASISLLAEALPEEARNRRIYAGDILIWQRLPAMVDLVERLGGHIRAEIGDDPEQAHRRMTEDELDAAIGRMRRAVAADETVSEGVSAALAATGVDLASNYGDGLKVRAQAPRVDRGLRGTAALPAHRDTWGSNIMAQTNWWAPIFPTTPERTIMLYPGWFERAVTNDSAHWDFAELLRRLKQDGPDTDYPFLPIASEPPAATDALPISIEPGDLMAFSGAHLHASAPNTTDRIRFSLELRTVPADDARAGTGAPNVDGSAPRITWQLFKRLSNGDKLGAME